MERRIKFLLAGFVFFGTSFSIGQSSRFIWKYFDTTVFQRYSVGRSEKDSILAIETKKRASFGDHSILISYPLFISPSGDIFCEKFFYSGILASSYVFSYEKYHINGNDVYSYDLNRLKSAVPGTAEWTQSAVALCYDELVDTKKQQYSKNTVYVPIDDPVFTTGSIDFHGATIKVRKNSTNSTVAFDILAPDLIK